MKRFKKLSVVIMLVLAFTFLMTACSAGSKIDTTLTINPDGTGNRKMSVQIDNQVFGQYFKGSYDNLEEVIKKNIPDAMKYEMKNTDGVKSIVFTIDFSSVEEYKNKIKTFGIENAKTEIAIADGVWTKGISVEENYESKDLLKWLSDALVKSGYVSSDNASMIFTNSGTYLVYDGNQKNTYSRIQANDIEQVDINKIDVLTEVNAINNYNRTIIFDVPQVSMDKRGAEIKAFFSKIPADIKDEKMDFGTRFTLSKGNLTYKDIEDFDKSVFGAKNVNIEEAAIEDEFSPFTFGQLYNETINLSDFVLGRNSIKFNVFGKAENGKNIYLTNNPSEMSYLRYSKSEEYPDYVYLNDYYGSSKDMQVPILAVKSYVVDNMDINTSRAALTGNWTRKSDFIFTDDIPEEDEKIILSRLNALVGVEEEVSETEETSATTENVEIEETSEKEESETSPKEEKSLGTVKFKTNAMGDGEHKITIIQKGDAQEIKSSSEALYKISGKLEYAVDSGFWKIIKKQAFVDNQDYTYMLGATGEDFKINYTMKLNPTSWIEYTEGETEEYPQMKLGKFTAVVTDKNVDISYTGSKIDFIAVFFWLFLVGAIVCAVIMLIKMGVFKAKPKPSDAPQLAEKAQQIVQEYPPMEKPEPQSPIIPKVGENTENIAESIEKVDENTEAELVADKTAVAVEEPQKTAKVCSNCGAKVGETSSFCTKCGTKIE